MYGVLLYGPGARNSPMLSKPSQNNITKGDGVLPCEAEQKRRISFYHNNNDVEETPCSDPELR